MLRRPSLRLALPIVLGLLHGADLHAQTSRRMAILMAEERGAPTAADLATIRAGVRSADPELARLAVRTLGRLERPPLAADIAPALGHSLPEVRSEAANAVASSFAAVTGSARATGSPAAKDPGAAIRTALTAAYTALAERLAIEEEPNVRAAIGEAIGRLPYQDSAQVELAERALIGLAGSSDIVADRLGAAKGLEALVRTHRPTRTLGADAVALLRTLVGVTDTSGVVLPTRDARVRRLALEALIAADAVDADLIARAADDPDAQMRRLSMLAAWRSARELEPPLLEETLRRGLADPVRLVRVEVLRGAGPPEADSLACALALATADDPDLHVAIAAIDRLTACGSSEHAAALLERAIDEPSDTSQPRGWHRAAHALVAFARTQPDRAVEKLRQFTGSTNGTLRLYAAKAAGVLQDRDTLEQLSRDPVASVAEAAASALSEPSAGSTTASAPQAALPKVTQTRLDPAEMKRLAAPRARVTVRGVGTFELALLPGEALSTVLGFVRLAESGYYDGATIGHIWADSTIEIRGEEAPPAEPTFRRAETGAWPHVRGTVGLAKEGTDRPARLFINLVDNPRFDHRHTVFGQTLRGLDVIDELLEGDIIERVEIVP